MAAKCYLALAGILAQFSSLHALEALDEATMSAVTGQAQGIRLTSEFDSTIDSITYSDDDGYYRSESGKGGTIRLAPVQVSTPTNRPLVIDVLVEDIDGTPGLVFKNRDLAIDVEIDKLEINDVSIGAFGNNNFLIGTQNGGAVTDEFRVELSAGGSAGANDNGVTINAFMPNSMAFDTFFEDPDGSGSNPGGRITSTVSFRSNSGLDGFSLNNVTLDVVDEGLRIGLPGELNNPTVPGSGARVAGDLNIYNAKLGGEILNSVAYRNIAFMPGGFLLLKNARGLNDKGIEMDLTLKKDSSLDYVYIAGEVDVSSNSVSDPNIYEGSASFTLLNDLVVEGARLNVDGERGVVIDFEQNVPKSDGSGLENRPVAASTRLLVNDIRFRRTDRTGNPNDLNKPVPTIGTFDVQLNLSSSSYLQVEGH